MKYYCEKCGKRTKHKFAGTEHSKNIRGHKIVKLIWVCKNDLKNGGILH